MRQIFTLLGLFTLLSLNAQDFNFSKISSDLEKKIQDQSSDAINIYILLSDQVDVLSMKADFERRKVTLDERSYELITALEAKAATTQGPLLDFLKHSDIDVESIKPFWVANLIQVEATLPVIAELSRRSDIGWLEPIPEMILSDHTIEACDAPPSPNGHERGHEAILATKMWEMGYTGHGQVAMIIDTGTDGDHPALYRNNRGIYFPGQGYSGSGQEPTDCNGHGSHVTGTICGLDRLNNDTIGVAFGAQWIGSPATLTPQCADALDATNHFQFAMNPDGDASTSSDMPAVINNSWGSPPGSGGCLNMNTFSTILTNLETAGVAVVWAAGNSGPSASSIGLQPDINLSLVNSFCVGNINANGFNLSIVNGSSRGPSNCGGTGSLLIKPEVSAPGQQIRSCNGVGGYQIIGGTSMASPHVAGAVLLLKEAFPYLTGEDIKLALYFSATDLGIAGEDNTYGMGIINLESAFNYLVAAGNTPVDPITSNDVIAIRMDMPSVFCNGEAGVSGEVEFENAGTNNLTTLDIQYEFRAGLTVIESGSYPPWTGNLAQNERATFTIPETPVIDGNYDFTVTFANPNNATDEHEMNNKLNKKIIFATPVPFDVAADVQPCNSSNALLTLDLPDGTNVDWFLTQGSTLPVGTGLSYLTPPLAGNYTFYIEATVERHAGILEEDPANSDVSSTGGLVFDAVTDIVLKSVKIYADVNGPRLIALKNSSGIQLELATYFVSTPGEQIVDLNFNVPAGDDYELVLNVGSDLHYTTNPSFPYTNGGRVIIKRSNDFTDPENRYPFFYDWVVEEGLICGRVPVTVAFAAVTDAPIADFNPSVSGAAVDFVNSSTNGSSYLWDFGDGSTSIDENPMHTYTDIGTYQVTLTTIGPEGCSDTEMKEVVVETITDITELEALNQIKVFPNPTKDMVNIRFDFEESQNVQITVVDLLGRVIKTNPQRSYFNELIELDVTNYSEGIYYVIFEIDGIKAVERIAKIK